jgi:predicted transcriptional regulator
MSKLRPSRKASEIAYTEKFYELNSDSPLSLALKTMTDEREIYRITIVDTSRTVRGVISGLRILEILSGFRGEIIKKRTSKGFKTLLEEPVHLFVEGYLHKLSKEISLTGLISYVMENCVGHVILVDQSNRLQGIITESCILKRLQAEDIRINISDIMTRQVYYAKPENTLFDSITIMKTHKIRRLPVFDDSDFKGIITVTDLIKHLCSNLYFSNSLEEEKIKKLLQEPISRIDLKQPKILNPKENIKIINLDEFGLGALILEDDHKIIGIVSPRDLVTKIPLLIGVQKFIEIIR